MKLGSYFKYRWDQHYFKQNMCLSPRMSTEKCDEEVFDLLKKDKYFGNLNYEDLAKELKLLYNKFVEEAKANGEKITEMQFKLALYHYNPSYHKEIDLKNQLSALHVSKCKDEPIRVNIYTESYVVPSNLLLSDELSITYYETTLNDIDIKDKEMTQQTYNYLKTHKSKNALEALMRLQNQVNLFCRLYENDHGSDIWKNEQKAMLSEIIKFHYKYTTRFFFPEHNDFLDIYMKLGLWDVQKKTIAKELIMDRRKFQNSFISLINAVFIIGIYELIKTNKLYQIKNDSFLMPMLTGILVMYKCIFYFDNKEAIKNNVLGDNYPSLFSHFNPLNFIDTLKFEKKSVAVDVTKKDLLFDYTAYFITSFFAFMLIVASISFVAFMLKNNYSANILVKILDKIIELIDDSKFFVAASITYSHLRVSHEYQLINESKGTWTDLVYPKKLYETASKNSVEGYSI